MEKFINKEEKTITMEEFDKAVVTAMGNHFEDDGYEGMARIMIPLIGTAFAGKMKSVLFGEDKEKGITQADFFEAKKVVVEEMVNDKEITGELKVIVPLTGSMFAHEIERVLFGESEDK